MQPMQYRSLKCQDIAALTLSQGLHDCVPPGPVVAVYLVQGFRPHDAALAKVFKLRAGQMECAAKPRALNLARVLPPFSEACPHELQLIALGNDNAGRPIDCYHSERHGRGQARWTAGTGQSGGGVIWC